MFKWLKRRLKKWLEDDEPVVPVPEPRPSTIEVYTEGKLVSSPIIGAIGPNLLVLNRMGRRAVRAHECPDQRAFWKAWKAWSPDNPNPMWEDGTPMIPE